MTRYPQLILLSSVLLACFGLHAEVIKTDSRYQVTESVSSVVYHSQESVAEVSATAIKPAAKTPEILVVKPADKQEHQPSLLVINPLPKKIIPAPKAGLVAEKTAVAVTSLPPVIIIKPTAELTIIPRVIPAAKPINPVVNTPVLATPTSNEEASLFSVISDWFSVKPVKPWQKGTLAKKAMKPGGEVPEFDVFSEKVFAYKQGSIGGNGVGGGGCGCN